MGFAGEDSFRSPSVGVVGRGKDDVVVSLTEIRRESAHQLLSKRRR